MFSDEQVAKLKAPLDSGRVKERRQGGRPVSYLEGYDCIDAANDVWGFDGWSYRVDDIKYVEVGLYQAIVTVEVGGVMRTDVGVCDVAFSRDKGIASASPDAHGTAIKGAVTGGLKRALRTFGNRFGNSLYSDDDPLGTGETAHHAPPATHAARPAAASAPQPPSGQACPTCGGPMVLKEGKSTKTGLPWKAWACQKGREACGQALIFVDDRPKPPPAAAPPAGDAAVPDLAREWAKLRELLQGQGFSPDEAKRYYARNTRLLGCEGQPPTVAQWLKLFGAAARAEDVDAQPSAERQAAAF